MRMYDIIKNKRDGLSLSKEEIDYFVQAYTAGQIPDYQVSALLMTIYFQGMTNTESALLTQSMANSGKRIDLSAITGIKVDKHSTGGVGDTTTLILAPLVASLGVKVAKMSGRGLGHTGGTLDKLESFPHFSIEVSNERFIQLVNENHLAVIGQSDALAPADKLLYSLRDVTATVDSIPLIASSIMSKKLASGADALVLDVKTGSGAFMKSEADAITLAETMVAIGKENGLDTTAIISSMEEPLGHAVGNMLEIKEAIETLNGAGPEDLTKLSLTLGAHMVVKAKKAKTVEEAYIRLEENINNGKALAIFKKFIAAQGGDTSIFHEIEQYPKVTNIQKVEAATTGSIYSIDAEKVGKAAMILGAGRETKTDIIDLQVGVLVERKIGDPVHKGESLFTVYSNNEERTKRAILLLQEAIEIKDQAQASKLIKHVIQ